MSPSVRVTDHSPLGFFVTVTRKSGIMSTSLTSLRSAYSDGGGRLRHRKPWLLGDTYSAVDPYALMLGRWTRGFARPARSLPNLGPYLQRVLARPALQRVFEQEALNDPRV